MLCVLEIAFDNFCQHSELIGPENGPDWTGPHRVGVTALIERKRFENASIISMIIYEKRVCTSVPSVVTTQSKQSKLSAQSIFSSALKSECRSAVVVGTHRDTTALNYIIS